jgi:diadenosine tetraphosphatase ApaH/serine/threonine PP2A family protein phosphatase
VRYLILADIHGNLHALDAVLAHAAGRYDATLCLGDLVGYGADPGAVIDRIETLSPCGQVRGNHDKVCAGLESAELFNDVARRAVEWTRRTLSPAQLTWLAAMAQGPLVIEPGLTICHGAPYDEDIYLFDRADATRALQYTDGLCLFGHTHLPALFTASPTWRPPATLRVPEGVLEVPAGPTLLNVGSVGQPRDGDPRAAYGILDWKSKTIELFRIDYDVNGAQQRILAAGLPTWLALRLERGQ